MEISKHLAKHYQKGRKEAFQEVLDLIDREIKDEKDTLKNKIERMGWTIIKELHLLRMEVNHFVNQDNQENK